jgi:hypothetical protein
MQGRGNARFPCTPSPKPTSTTNNRLAARTGKKLGCGNDARWNPWKSPTPTFPPLPPHLEIPQQTRDSHIPTATTTTGHRGLDQHQTKINTKINTNNKTKVVYTDNLTHPGILYQKSKSPPCLAKNARQERGTLEFGFCGDTHPRLSGRANLDGFAKLSAASPSRSLCFAGQPRRLSLHEQRCSLIIELYEASGACGLSA